MSRFFVSTDKTQSSKKAEFLSRSRESQKMIPIQQNGIPKALKISD